MGIIYGLCQAFFLKIVIHKMYLFETTMFYDHDKN